MKKSLLKRLRVLKQILNVTVTSESTFRRNFAFEKSIIMLILRDDPVLLASNAKKVLISYSFHLHLNNKDNDLNKVF